MTPWEDIEKEPEFEALTPEDRASLFDEWKGGILSAAADEDPETIDPVGINQFVATSNARRRSLLEGTPFDEAAALQEYQQSLQTTAQKQADLLRRFNEAETARFQLKDTETASTIDRALRERVGGNRPEFAQPDEALTQAQKKLKSIEGTFAPGQMEQAKAAREALRGERSAAVLDGEIVVDPALTLNSSEYRDAVKAADASPEAKARALAAFQQNKKQFLRASLSTLRAAGEAPLPGMTSFATWESKLPPEEYRKPPEEKVANYLREMKDRGGFRKLTSAIGTALMQGGADVATQGIGVAAMATGSPELAEQASQVSQGAELMGEASRLEGDLSATGATTAAGVARMAVPIIPAIGAAALTGGGVPVAAAVAGLQTAGSQFPSTYSALREQGKTEEEALSAARGSALLSGTVTAALTAVGGATGIEGILRQGGQKVVRSRLIEALKAVPGGALKEIPEELTDELASQIIEQKTITPDKPVSQIIDEFTAQAPDLALQVALLGGAGEAVGTFRGTEVTPPPAPTVATPPPVQPAAATATPEVAANVAEADMGMPQTAGTPVTLDGQNYTISIPPDSTIAPETVAGFYDDPDTLRALADRGDIRLEQVIAPAETVDTTPLNDNLAVSAALAPETVAAVAAVTKVTADLRPFVEDAKATRDRLTANTGVSSAPIPQPAVTTAQETPVAPAESGGGSLGQSSIAAGGSIPAVTEPTVPQTSDVSSPEIEAAADPFAPVAEAVAPETGAEVPAVAQPPPVKPKRRKKAAPASREGVRTYTGSLDQVFAEESDPNTRNRILRSAVRKAQSDTELQEILNRIQPQQESGNANDVANDVLVHPRASAETKERARALYDQAFKGTGQPIEETPAVPTPLAAPLRPKFEAGETVTFKVNGQPVIGTIQRVSGGGNATVTYNWNGKKDQEIVLRTSEIQRPVLALAEAPNYKYTQEQNTRKAARFGIPTEPGVTVNAAPVITSALERIASDTAMPPMLRAVARALQRQNYDGVDLRIVADGRLSYAGQYLAKNGRGVPEIELNMRAVGRGQTDAVATLLHELLHHVTLAKIRDPQGEIETQAVEALDTLRKRIKAYAGMQQKATKFSYELGTVDEFITALFTRPDFQDFIAGIPDTFVPGTPGSKFRSVLSEIFRIIAQLVTGQRVQKGGMLDQAFASSLTLFETPQRAARGAGVDYSMAEKRGIRIKLSPSETDLADWLVGGPMAEVSSMEEVLERDVTEEDLPTVENGELVLPAEDVATDALYRVSVQMEDMIDDYRDNGATPSQVAAARRAARSLADKIRAALPDTRQSATDTAAPEIEPVFTPDEARAILTKRFGKAVADKFVIEVMAPRRMGNREVEVDAELRGGTISLNLKFMDNEDILVQKAEHEMAHAVYSDKKVQDAWRDLSASMPPDARQRITERMKQAGYDPRVLNEEVLVRFFEEVRATTPPSKWKAFMDAVIDAFRRFFGAAPDERTARLAAARIIAAGEAAVARGLDPSKQAFGQSVSDLIGAMDAEYMAAVEAGDMEKAQRMVDEAAKAAGYDGPYFHGSDEYRVIFDGGAFFTDSKSDASGYARLRSIYKSAQENDELMEIVSDVMSEEGMEDITDMSPDTLIDIAEANGFELNDANGFVFRGFLNTGNVLDISDMGASGSVRDAWDFLHEKGLIDEPWSEMDEEVKGEILDQYQGKAYYRILEGEGIFSKAFSQGYDTVKFADQDVTGKVEHDSWITKKANQFKSADPVTRDDEGNVIPLSKRFGPSPDIRFSVATQRDYAFQRNLTGEAAEMKNLATIRPWKETVRLAREIIEPYKKADTSKDKMAGRREALQRLMTDTSIDPNVRAAGFMQLALETDTLASVAKTPEQQAAYDDFSSIPATGYGVLESSIDPASVKFDSVSQMMEMGTEAGRMLNTFRLLAAMTPDGFIRKSERVRRKKVDEATEQQFGTTPQKLLELMWNETAKAERDAVEKAKKEIKRRSPEAIAKAAIDRLNEMLAGPPRPRGKPSEVSELLRKHLYNPVEGFTDKLVALGVEKETADALDAVAATVRADLAKLEEANAVERLTKSLKPKTRAAKSAIPRLMRVLLEAGKTGAFDSKAFNDALAEAFNFPPMTAEQEKEIRRMVAEINKLPMGAARVDKQQELQNYVAMVQGIPARDVLMSALYANWLSGISTQAIGLTGNSANLGLRSLFIAMTNNPEDVKNYFRGALGIGAKAGFSEAKAALGNLAKLAKGQEDTVRGQFKIGRLDSPQIANALEVLFRKGPTTPAEWVAYIASIGTRTRAVFRLMMAIDSVFWNSAREGMYHLAASRTVRKMAKEQSMTKEEANAEFIRQLGGGPEVFEKALKDAEAALKDAGQPADMATITRMAYEAINRIREKENPEAVKEANRFADRIVFQGEPEGIGRLISKIISALQQLLTPFGFPLGQMLVPFNKIVSSLFEQSLDYTGLGLVRGVLGMHLSDARIDWSKGVVPHLTPAQNAKVFSDVERRERAMAGFVGLTLSAAAYLAAKSHMDDDDDEVPFMLYAFGPSDKNKREQMPAGWVPFSIKVGDTYYRYAEWPLGMVLAGFAAALDAERYGNMKEKDTMDRIGYSAMLGLKGFMTQGVLSNVDTAIDALMFKATGKKYTDIPVNAAKGLIPAQGFLRDISSLFDNTKVSNDDVMSALLRDVPFAKSLGTKPQLNVFGEPVEMEGEAILRRFLTQRRPHPTADYLTRNKLYIPGMAETVDVGDYLPASERDRFKRRAMQMAAMDNGVFTPEQNYAFRKRAGELTKSAVERVMKQAPAIRTEEQRKAVQNLIDKQVALARRRAMVEAVPYQPPPAQ